MVRKKTKRKGGRTVGVFGSVSGVGSIVSAHNVCHTLCVVVVAFLSVFGIAASSTILMFLEDYNIIFWSLGMIFLIMGLVLYVKFPRCMPRKLLILNSGFLIIGMPLTSFVPPFIFWTAGGLLVSFVTLTFVKERFLVKI